MRCGNNIPRSQWTPEERKIVEDFTKYLRLRYAEDEMPYIVTEEERGWLKAYEEANRPQSDRKTLSSESSNKNLTKKETD